MPSLLDMSYSLNFLKGGLYRGVYRGVLEGIPGILGFIPAHTGFIAKV